MPPSEDEIEKTVLGLPNGKSSGGDGVTYKFFQGCWSFVGNCCKGMIQDFWTDAKLPANTVNGIVKMVPKHNDLLEYLDYWRNLTMLTSTYKIIAKILVERFKPIVPKIVDKQQTGFVQGRCILDNLLALKLGQEHARTTLQDIIFLKLDFEKLFDRVDHDYLWATLAAMVLDPFVITLLQGTIRNVEAEVHVNGLYTLPFDLERGVHQGDPLSPILFSLSSQPLMNMLAKKRSLGELTGLRISGDKYVLY